MVDFKICGIWLRYTLNHIHVGVCWWITQTLSSLNMHVCKFKSLYKNKNSTQSQNYISLRLHSESPKPLGSTKFLYILVKTTIQLGDAIKSFPDLFFYSHDTIFLLSDIVTSLVVDTNQWHRFRIIKILQQKKYFFLDK